MKVRDLITDWMIEQRGQCRTERHRDGSITFKDVPSGWVIMRDLGDDMVQSELLQLDKRGHLIVSAEVLDEEVADGTKIVWLPKEDR